MKTLSLSPSRVIHSIPFLSGIRESFRKWTPVYPTEVEEQYHGYGYLIIDPDIPSETIDKAADDLMNRPGMKGTTHSGTRWFDVGRAVGHDCNRQTTPYASRADKCGATSASILPITSARDSSAAARIALASAVRFARPWVTMQLPRNPKSGAPPYVS